MRSERQRKILELVLQNNEISVAEICTLFNVSEMTARRDLQDLAREGLLWRVHGGAVNNLGRGYEPPYQLRSTKHSDQKQRIGQRAAELVHNGDSIALDVGTTTLTIARALEGKRNLTVVTASLPIANEIVTSFSLNDSIRLILTGGIVRAGELSMIGTFAAEMYSQLHVDKAFIGIGGLSLQDGLTEYNLEDAAVKRSMLKSARQVIVVADGSKFGQTTFASIAPLSAVDTVITDPTAPLDIVEQLCAMHIEVIIAE
ncbi:MAG: DeoR/GlpR transcriptional regulator [Chloroflexi bacterium]|nr:MAG: DeoR/GlpR transcriptional regulator [Chloroflexota bacterium]